MDQLTREVEPLRPFRERLRALEADNKQLENQLSTLQRIVPSEKEVDDFVRLLQNEASVAGITVRRYTAKPAIQAQYYVEVPFELELDGSYYDVMQFYERLGRVERITNVTDLRMGGLGTNPKYPVSPGATISAICTVTTFFSREETPAAPAAPGVAAR